MACKACEERRAKIIAAARLVAKTVTGYVPSQRPPGVAKNTVARDKR